MDITIDIACILSPGWGRVQFLNYSNLELLKSGRSPLTSEESFKARKKEYELTKEQIKNCFRDDKKNGCFYGHCSFFK